MDELVTLDEANDKLKKATEEFYEYRRDFRVTVVATPIILAVISGLIALAFVLSDEASLAAIVAAAMIFSTIGVHAFKLPELGRSIEKAKLDVAHWQDQVHNAIDVGWLEDHYFTGELPDGTWWIDGEILTEEEVNLKVIQLFIEDRYSEAAEVISQDHADRVWEGNQDYITSKQREIASQKRLAAEQQYRDKHPVKKPFVAKKPTIDGDFLLTDPSNWISRPGRPLERQEALERQHDPWNSPRWREDEVEQLSPVYMDGDEVVSDADDRLAAAFAEAFGRDLQNLAVHSSSCVCFDCLPPITGGGSEEGPRKIVKAMPNLAMIEGTEKDKAWIRHRYLRPGPRPPQHRPGAQF